MNLISIVLHTLDASLNLQGRALAFDVHTRLLGELPELDSMGVLALITGLEEEFGIAFDESLLQSAAFETVGTLCALVEQSLPAGQH